MINFVITMYELLKSPECLFTIVALSFTLKIYFILSLLPHGKNHNQMIKPWAFLLCTIVSSMLSDFAWIIKLIRMIIYADIPYAFIVFSIRIAWAFLVIQHQSFSFFIQSIIHKQFRLSQLNKIMLSISTIFCGYFLYLAFFDFNINATEFERKLVKSLDSNNEFFIMQVATVFILMFLIMPALYSAYSNMHSSELPKIIRSQLKQFILFFITPYLLVECLLGIFTRSISSSLYPIVSLSSLMLVCAIHYCLKRVMLLRFLNSNTHVQGKPHEHVIEDFKLVLERLNQAISLHELSHIAQSFFKNSFGIHPKDIQFTIRNLPKESPSPQLSDHHIEKLLHSDDQELLQAIFTEQIILYDEIAFNQFYTHQPVAAKMLSFLDTINTEIFLPIYIKHTIVAYIAITKQPNSSCYSQADRDVMLVFARYIGNSIIALQQQNMQTFIHNEKKLKDTLYAKHQEINQYKESIEAFLHQAKNKEIGIIFSTDNQFSFGNDEAHELLSPHSITQKEHPVYQALKHITEHVKNYMSPCTQFTYDGDRMLILSGVPHVEHNSIIITVMYPDISDIINKQIHQIRDPNNWHYLLYLESTKTGKLINQLIPSYGEVLLNYKIDLLKASLSKSSLLLNMPEQDAIATIKLLHQVSLRDTLHTISLTRPTSYEEIAPKIFGSHHAHHISLLKQLHDVGTLAIHNIHYLDQATQKALATFIQYGLYTPYKGEYTQTSNVRLMCTTTQNIAHLVQNESIHPQLYTALKPITLSMPSILLLPQDELYSLIDGFTDQIIKIHTFKNSPSLSTYEKEKVIAQRPASMQELKAKIHQILIKKSKECNKSSTADYTNEIHDPVLIHAARLGRQALKDNKIMDILWHKFRNQNKIALFLGVNRSSIHRRFKTLELSDHTEGIA